MDLNYVAFFMISFIPLVIGYFWYGSSFKIYSYFSQSQTDYILDTKSIILLFILSVGVVYGYMNLIIHQLGFYELFFTDIMMGNEDAEQIVFDFLNMYGQKHRHFGHGVLHGIINACLFAAPILAALSILEKKSVKYFSYHFSYWLVVSMIMGGCISEFI